MNCNVLHYFWVKVRAKVASSRMRGFLVCDRFRVVGHTTTLAHCDAVGRGASTPSYATADTGRQEAAFHHQVLLRVVSQDVV